MTMEVGSGSKVAITLKGKTTVSDIMKALINVKPKEFRILMMLNEKLSKLRETVTFYVEFLKANYNNSEKVNSTIYRSYSESLKIEAIIGDSINLLFLDNFDIDQFYYRRQEDNFKASSALEGIYY